METETAKRSADATETDTNSRKNVTHA